MVLVTSRLDYANSALYGITQNNAARLTTRTKKSDHITPILKILHWLPVKKRILLKILSLVHSAIHGTSCPIYIQELIHLYRPQRALRSTSDGLLLDVQSTRGCLAIGDRAFQVCGPRLWNDLPFTLRNTESPATFKKKLKTHLFNLHFV